MSSPAVAIYCGDSSDFSWEKVKFHYHTINPKFYIDWTKPAGGFVWARGYVSKLGRPYENNEERFRDLAEWAYTTIYYSVSLIKELPPVVIAIEDYAMGAKGRVFEIAENTGCLKQILRKADCDFKLYPPTVVKKFATGKGNAKKEQMYEAWMDETGFDIWKLMTPGRTKISSPVTDIVDAYFILKKLVVEDV